MKVKKDIRDILVMIIGFWVISGVLYFKGKTQPSEIMFATITVIGIISLIIKKIRDLVLKGWFLIAQALGWVNSRILLTTIFYLILFPTSLIKRIFSNKDDLMLKDSDRKSTFTERNHTYVKRDMKYGW